MSPRLHGDSVAGAFESVSTAQALDFPRTERWFDVILDDIVDFSAHGLDRSCTECCFHEFVVSYGICDARAL